MHFPLCGGEGWRGLGWRRRGGAGGCNLQSSSTKMQTEKEWLLPHCHHSHRCHQWQPQEPYSAVKLVDSSCRCGGGNGQPIVECTTCKKWSHLHCEHLNARTVGGTVFHCQRCSLEGQLSSSPSSSNVMLASVMLWFSSEYQYTRCCYREMKSRHEMCAGLNIVELNCGKTMSDRWASGWVLVFLFDELQTEAHASTCTSGSLRPTAGATEQNSQ